MKIKGKAVIINIAASLSLLAFVLFGIAPALAQPVGETAASDEEEIVVTTYYPAPFGEYNSLTVYGDTDLAVESGNVGIGTPSPDSKLDLNGDLTVRGIEAPEVSPAGQGRIYFDSTSRKFRVSENSGAYKNLGTATGVWTKIADVEVGTQGYTLDIPNTRYKIFKVFLYGKLDGTGQNGVAANIFLLINKDATSPTSYLSWAQNLWGMAGSGTYTNGLIITKHDFYNYPAYLSLEYTITLTPYPSSPSYGNGFGLATATCYAGTPKCSDLVGYKTICA